MRWVALPNNGDVPKARSSHSITAVKSAEGGEVLYVWGGEHAPRVPIGTDMHAYSMGDRTWRKVEATGALPPPRNAHAAAAIGLHIYIFGGRCGIDIGEGSLNDLWRFDTSTATWSEVQPATDARPPRRSYHAMAAGSGPAGEGKLYVFGGCGEGCVGRLNDLWEFSVADATWRQLPASSAIKGRGGAGFSATPDALFVVAGFTGQEMNDVHRFDLRTESWDCPRCCSPEAKQAATAAGGSCGHDEPVALPARSVCVVATHGCSSCSHSNHILLFGGEVDPSTQGHAGAGLYSSDAFCMDTACQHWHRILASGDVPAPRGWLAGTACSSGVVVHGGNGEDNQRLSDMYLLEMH